MNSIDWSIIGLMSISSIISAIRGAAKESLSLLVWLLSALIASMFHDQVEVLLINIIEDQPLRALIAWVSIFLLCLFLGATFNYFFGKFVKASGLTGTDRLLGIIFGIVRALIITMVFLTVIPKIFPAAHTEWWIESTLIPYFQPFQGWAQDTGTATLIFLKNLF